MKYPIDQSNWSNIRLSDSTVPTELLTEWLANRTSDMMTDWQTGRQTHWLTDWLNDWLADVWAADGRKENWLFLSYSSYHLILFYSISFHLISYHLKTAVFSDPPVSSSSRPMPYCWQYKESDSYQWNNFGHVDNVAIEKLFCDVENLQVSLVLKGTSSLRWEKIK